MMTINAKMLTWFRTILRHMAYAATIEAVFAPSTARSLIFAAAKALQNSEQFETMQAP